MLIGAEARNLIHERLGHTFTYSATQDIDISFAMPDWPSYKRLTDGLRPVNDSGIAFAVAGHHVDIIPFGAVESSSGILIPPWRENDPIDVFAMSAVYEAADTLSISGREVLRIPTVPGYAALKIKAWIDRSAPARGVYKDGADLGLVLFWCENDADAQGRLWEEDSDALKAHEYDIAVASARILGRDIRALLGEAPADLLMSLWTIEGRELLASNIAPRDYRAALKLGNPDQISARLSALANGLAGH
jgi:predicted nucleotidyltransferase